MTGPKGQSRRSFLKWSIGTLSAVGAGLLGWPLLSSIIRPIYRMQQAPFVKLGPMGSFPQGEPVSLRFQLATADAYIRSDVQHDVWVVKHSDTDVTVFSPICPHLGCHCDWYPQAKRFICPCHGSIFSEEGKVLGGPSPRPLDTLPWKIADGKLYAKWEQFEVGVSQKVRVG